MMNKKTVRN